MGKPFKMLVALAAAVSVNGPARAQQAQSPSPLIGALRACHSIADSAQKLSCYERAGTALTTAEEKGDVAVVHREQVKKVRRSLFGFAVPKFPFFSDRDEDKEEEPREIVSTVQSFRSIGNGRFRITIEEASAVWETTESSMLRDPKPGEKVTIESGTLGSYFIQVGSQRWVRARRVR
jgi:hypothetical protein